MRRRGDIARDLETIRGWCNDIGADARGAEEAYRAAVSKSVTRGRSARSVMAAAVYVAARRAGLPMTARRVSVETGVPLKSVYRASNALARELPMPPQDARLYLADGWRRLGLAGEPPASALDRALEGPGPAMRAALALHSCTRGMDEPPSAEAIAGATGLNAKTLCIRLAAVRRAGGGA